jgi:hypothetical protein
MARPGPPFPSLPDYVRAELRSVNSNVKAPATKIASATEDDDEDDDRDLPIPTAAAKSAVPRNVFGRAEDEITSELAIPAAERARPLASEPPTELPQQTAAVTPWQPLSDDEATGEALLSSLKRTENPSDGEPGPGGPGLN